MYIYVELLVTCERDEKYSRQGYFISSQQKCLLHSALYISSPVLQVVFPLC